jgi:O-methyltransferase
MTPDETVAVRQKPVALRRDKPTPFIDKEADFMRLFERVKDYTMTSKEALYALYTSVNFILDRNIPGAIVECGVWRGGSALLAALILQERGIHNRPLYLFDTFEGMTTPTAFDIHKHGKPAEKFIEEFLNEFEVTDPSLEEVKDTFAAHSFTFDIHFVKGDVVETLKTEQPDPIALLRLDTDWYESTKAELEYLYPNLTQGGVLIIDDYGCWAGARKATDEYFQKVPRPLLIRIDSEVRLAIRV